MPLTTHQVGGRTQKTPPGSRAAPDLQGRAGRRRTRPRTPSAPEFGRDRCAGGAGRGGGGGCCPLGAPSRGGGRREGRRPEAVLGRPRRRAGRSSAGRAPAGRAEHRAQAAAANGGGGAGTTERGILAVSLGLGPGEAATPRSHYQRDGRVPAARRGRSKLRRGPGEGRGAAIGGARGTARCCRPRHGPGGRGGALRAGLAGGRPLLPAVPGRWRRGLRSAAPAAARLEDPAVARLPAALPASELPERRQRRQAP